MDNNAVSPVVGTILLIAITIILVVTVALLLTGTMTIGTSTYVHVAPHLESGTGNTTYFTIENSAGGSILLEQQSDSGYAFVLTKPDGTTVLPSLPPSTENILFGPGTEVSIYQNSSGDYVLTPDQATAASGASGSVPNGIWYINLVNQEQSLIIAKYQLLVSGSSGNVSAVPVPPDAVAYFDFEDGFDDLTDNGNNGTNNGATLTEGVSGTGVAFDGDAWISISDDPTLNPRDEMTVESWVKWTIDPRTGDKWANILNKGDGDHGTQYQLQHDQNNNKFEFALAVERGDGTIQRQVVWQDELVPIQDNEWYHIVGTYSNTDEKVALFVNGQKQEERTFSQRNGTGNQIRVTDDDLTLGRNDQSGRYFEGVLDGVTVYDRRLTDAEILAAYNASAS